jgi:hypothetical protein
MSREAVAPSPDSIRESPVGLPRIIGCRQTFGKVRS